MAKKRKDRESANRGRELTLISLVCRKPSNEGRETVMREFNTTGLCNPEKHYMVDISDRIDEIKKMVDAGKYFCINRARQYGKTTTLSALRKELESRYTVVSVDFQGISASGFGTEEKFVQEFCGLLRREKRRGVDIPKLIADKVDDFYNRKEHLARLSHLFDALSEWCESSESGVVLMIDEVDSAADNQVFLDFLAQLREDFLSREDKGTPAFWSVILAGVTDVRNLKRKFRSDDAHKTNSPWNIAVPFTIDMSLSASGINGMLKEYESDHNVGMDTGILAGEIYDYTNGYPFLVSRICEVLDRELTGTSDRFASLKDAWTAEGIREAVRIILDEKNTLFDSLLGKIYDNKDLSNVIERILFSGERVSYNAYILAMDDTEMYGFTRKENGSVFIANRMFETLLYNYYLTLEEMKSTPIYIAGSNDKEDYVIDGKLQMEKLMEHYVTVYDDIYGDVTDRFKEEEGRRRFLLYIRPVINGTGNYYIEAETRNNKRMDLVIDYLGEQYIIELKIWHGQAYHANGEAQLADYLESKHQDCGYMLTYSFNEKKQRGMICHTVKGKRLVEVFV